MSRKSVFWRTVPAQINIFSPNSLDKFVTLASGSGEFNGTSIILNPLSTSTLVILIISLDWTPRRIATSGFFCKYEIRLSVVQHALLVVLIIRRNQR